MCIWGKGRMCESCPVSPSPSVSVRNLQSNTHIPPGTSTQNEGKIERNKGKAS